MAKEVHISECARQLGVHPQHLRMLEWQGRIPPARRDLNGRVYSEFDIELLCAMGVGSRPRKLKRPEEVLGASGEPRIVYSPRPDATPEAELNALAAIYKVLLDAHERKKVAPASHPDAAKENTADEILHP